MSKKRPGLTKIEHVEAKRLFTEMSNRLCHEAVKIANLYPLANPPKHVRDALRKIVAARDCLADVRLSLESQFYAENPDYRGTLAEMAAQPGEKGDG